MRGTTRERRQVLRQGYRWSRGPPKERPEERPKERPEQRELSSVPRGHAGRDNDSENLF